MNDSKKYEWPDGAPFPGNPYAETRVIVTDYSPNGIRWCFTDLPPAVTLEEVRTALKNLPIPPGINPDSPNVGVWVETRRCGEWSVKYVLKRAETKKPDPVIVAGISVSGDISEKAEALLPGTPVFNDGKEIGEVSACRVEGDQVVADIAVEKGAMPEPPKSVDPRNEGCFIPWWNSPDVSADIRKEFFQNVFRDLAVSGLWNEYRFGGRIKTFEEFLMASCVQLWNLKTEYAAEIIKNTEKKS